MEWIAKGNANSLVAKLHVAEVPLCAVNVMNTSEIAQRYFDAWNNRDAAAIVATFAEGGTYSDPATQGPLQGEAIGQYAEAIWKGFPDLSFDIVSVAASNSNGLVAAEWTMKGTNSGPFNGLPPSGKSLSLPGADFIRIEGNRIRSVQGYFDSAALPRLLDLDVIVQPRSLGPFHFGVSTRVTSGNKAVPGAFSITSLEARSDEEKEKIRESSRKVAQELLSMPGFISFVGVTVGDRMMTVTAWETADAMAPLMRGGEHRSATSRFLGPELARGGATGVWMPARLNPRWIRCTTCSRMSNSAEPTCACGATLPEPIVYW